MLSSSSRSRADLRSAKHMHTESHAISRMGWLRASVLGANDGIVSTASLIIGVASAGASAAAIITAGVAALVAGAMSMAAGEYVSVSAQADSEQADIAREKLELAHDHEHELDELTGIYRKRGLDDSLARQVAIQLTAHDALAAHARDELGLVPGQVAQPLQAALSSALSFAVGSALPLLLAVMANRSQLIWITALGSLLCLAVLGASSARAGKAKILPAVWRVSFWGALAMLITAGVGRLFGVQV